MFRISLDLEEISLTGLDALDERRRLGLPDGTELYTLDDRSCLAEVSESFARAYFNRVQISKSVEAPLRLLQPGDLEARENGVAAFSEKMIGQPERIRELFLLALQSGN